MDQHFRRLSLADRIEWLAAIARAKVSPTGLRIASIIALAADSGMCTYGTLKLSRILNVGRNNLYKHIRELDEAGFLRRVRIGPDEEIATRYLQVVVPEDRMYCKERIDAIARRDEQDPCADRPGSAHFDQRPDPDAVAAGIEAKEREEHEAAQGRDARKPAAQRPRPVPDAPVVPVIDWGAIVPQPPESLLTEFLPVRIKELDGHFVHTSGWDARQRAAKAEFEQDCLAPVPGKSAKDLFIMYACKLRGKMIEKEPAITAAVELHGGERTHQFLKALTETIWANELIDAMGPPQLPASPRVVATADGWMVYESTGEPLPHDREQQAREEAERRGQGSEWNACKTLLFKSPQATHAWALRGYPVLSLEEANRMLPASARDDGKARYRPSPPQTEEEREQMYRERDERLRRELEDPVALKERLDQMFHGYQLAKQYGESVEDWPMLDKLREHGYDVHPAEPAATTTTAA